MSRNGLINNNLNNERERELQYSLDYVTTKNGNERYASYVCLFE